MSASADSSLVAEAIGGKYCSDSSLGRPKLRERESKVDDDSGAAEWMCGSGGCEILNEACRGIPVGIKFSKAERELALGCLVADAELERRVRVGKVAGGRVTVSLTLDQLDDLLGSIAAEANHCEDTGRQGRLDRLYERLEKIERAHPAERDFET